MPVSGVDIEAANKRKAEHIEKESAGAGSESTPQQGTNASAGTQQGAISASSGPPYLETLFDKCPRCPVKECPAS